MLDSFFIDGGRPTAVQLSGCDDCVLSNGTLTRLATSGIYFIGNDSAILNINVTGSNYGIRVNGDRNTVRGNHVEGSEVAVTVFGPTPSQNVVEGNVVEDNVIRTPVYDGISLVAATNTTVRRNRVYDAGRAGILLFTPPSPPGNVFLDNLIQTSATGVLSEQSQALFSGNTFRGNGIGVSLTGASNQVYRNHFEFNTVQAQDSGAGNVWDHGYPSGGNWWSDYAGIDLYNGPNQNIPGSDGIGDTPRPVAPNGVDRYPFYSVLAPSPPLRVTARPVGPDIVVTWVPGLGPRSDRFLVYRGPNATGFDFSSPVANVSAPTWTDAGGAVQDGPAYYTIRALNLSLPAFSVTGNTAGKWTHSFPAGTSTFSLPFARYPWVDYSQPGWTDTVGDFLLDTGVQVSGLDNGTWRIGDFGERLEPGRGYSAFAPVPRIFTFAGLPGAMVAYCGFPPCPFRGFVPGGDARSLSASVNGDDVVLRWTAPAGMFLGDSYEVRAAESPERVVGDPGVDYAVFAASVSGFRQDSFVHRGALASAAAWYYLIVPLKYGAWRGASAYGIGVVSKQLGPGYSALGLPVEPYAGGAYQSLKVSALTSDPVIRGILWFEPARGDWVAHAAWMTAGTYDAAFTMIMAVQVDIATPTRIVFVGV